MIELCGHLLLDIVIPNLKLSPAGRYAVQQKKVSQKPAGLRDKLASFSNFTQI